MTNLRTQEVSGPVYLIVLLANLIPSLALTVRRLHDFNAPGMVILISMIPPVGVIAPIVFGCIKGSPCLNRLGPPPGQSLTDLRETFA
jgi:uncharacterized membrane protein YhaH (DUF805 family)